MGHRRQVVDRIRDDVGHDPPDGGAVGDIRLDVDDRDLVAPILEVRSEPLAHEALPAGDERAHAAEPYCDAASATA